MPPLVISRENITIGGKIMKTVKTSSIRDIITPITTETIIDIDDNYKYIAFTNTTPNIIYDFTNYNNLSTWMAYANTIPTATYNYNNFSGDGLWASGWFYLGYFQMPLPNTHNYMEISYGNRSNSGSGKTQLFFNGVVIDEVIGISTKIFKSNYTGTPLFRMIETSSETDANFIIKLFNIETYNINFQEQTEVQLLLLDDTKYIETAPFLFSGIGNITVGTPLPSIFNTITTTTNSTAYNSGFLSGITGTNITYNTPQVIIRYKTTKNFDAQWTYNSTNPSVYHLGNVGIGTTNPMSALEVIGSVVVNGDITSTTIVANAKNFKIAHPLGLNKSLYHGCVESSRFDNIYRGKKKVINGICEVDIDNECNTTGGMTAGTFMALNSNFSLYVRNNKTYDRVYGIINGSKITINCENIVDEIEIDWLVIGERKDKYVINVPMTTNIGSLICEHDVV